ncbi:hypothetical protein JVU11DRAFT_10091 [Chiua virens]|nr:hypothetical protein JVU11DRAFT_10091 [Chiua virens]
MSLADPSKLERIHEFLRKSLLGQELINTQFHLFSARSATSRRLTKPRVLCANNVLLAKNSKYFLGLLSSDVSPTDPSLSDLTDNHDVPNNVSIDDYDYASDSDLEGDDEALAIPVADIKKPKDRSVAKKTSRISVTRQPKDDDELSQDGSESDSSDIFVMSPEHPRLDEPFPDGAGSLASMMSSETVVQEMLDGEIKNHGTAARLRFLGNRHILVKDTAFQTYYTLLNYLYTGEVGFLPLTSAVAAGGQPRESSTSSLEEPRCSSKSMYRLAYKVGLDRLRDEAFAHIKSNLSENNILKELSCSLVSRYPKLLEMELDVLYSLLASPLVVTGFPVLAQRIANKELAHGADVIIGIHTRLLRGPLSWVKEPGVPPPQPSSESAGTSESKSFPVSPCCPSSPGVGIPANFPPTPFGGPPDSPAQPQGNALSLGFGHSNSPFSSWGAPAGQGFDVAIPSPEPAAPEPAYCEAQPVPKAIFNFPAAAKKEPPAEADMDDPFAAKMKSKGKAAGGVKGRPKKM